MATARNVACLRLEPSHTTPDAVVALSKSSPLEANALHAFEVSSPSLRCPAPVMMEVVFLTFEKPFAGDAERAVPVGLTSGWSGSVESPSGNSIQRVAGCNARDSLTGSDVAT